MRTSGIFYIAVVQVLLLYGLEMWVMSPRIGRTMGGLHHQVVRRQMGKMPQSNMDGTWKYLYLEEAGVQDVVTYIACHQNTATNFIVTRPIMDLCLAAVRFPVDWVPKWWWEQEGLDL